MKKIPNENILRLRSMLSRTGLSRSMAYALISDRVKHYSASVQVFADADARSRVVWIIDVLPNEIAPYIDGQMDEGVHAMQKALRRRSAST